jgi:hypothetical protein
VRDCVTAFESIGHGWSLISLLAARAEYGVSELSFDIDRGLRMCSYKLWLQGH